MTTLSEPLQLALTPGAIVPVDVETTSALMEEVRRLHAELDRCKTTCDAIAECWRLDAEQWKAQRDALLEALKEIQDWTARATARAAIAKAEGEDA